LFFEAIDGFLPELQRPRVTASVGYVAATLLLGLCCRCDGRAWISRGRVRHHNRQLADLQRQGDAGNGQRVEMARRYFGNGSEAEKGWRKRGRVPVY